MNRRALLCALSFAAAAQAYQSSAIIQEQSHQSQVMGTTRVYRVFLPPAYAASPKRYPVIYWFHGYEAPDERRDQLLSQYVASHDVLLVDSGPAETSGNFPLYLAELIDQIDRTLRTIPDRAHRAVTGFGTGGFVALFDAAKSPDLVGSASSFLAELEADTGPEAFPVTTALEDLAPGRDAVATWIAGSEPDIAAALDFHLKAFAAAARKPDAFTHADPYPNFAIWDWEVASDRRSPGFTMLENVGRSGFRSAVREWLPGGTSPGEVNLSITSAKLYTPGSTLQVTYIHLADGKTRHATQKVDAQGRLSFELNGDAWEIGVGAGPVIAAEDYTVADAAWATAGKPVNLKVNFLNKGAARSQPAAIRWECTNPAVRLESTAGRVFGLAPGEMAPSPVTFTYTGNAPATVRLAAVASAERMPVDVRLFPAAEATKDFEIADGRAVEGYPHELGKGDRDGHASPGETFAILLREAGGLKAAEVFTSEPCVDLATRIGDGAERYSLPRLRESCEPGRIVHLLVHAGGRWAAVEFPVWYRK